MVITERIKMAALTTTPSTHMSLETIGEPGRGGGGRERRRETNQRNGRGIRKSLSHRTSPSTSSSIPSKYQTFFYATTESKGFNSQASRFTQPEQSSLNDLPGPGSYGVEPSCLETKSTSLSKKGTGGFASKTKRFSRDRQQVLGPGSYNPLLPTPKQDFNKAGASSNFQRPIATVGESTNALDSSPAPNVYNLSGVHTGRNNLVTAEAAFKSKTKRDSLSLPTAANPPPGQYTVNDDLLHHSTCSHQAVFKSQSKRTGVIQPNKGPGPADYSPFSSSAPDNQPKPLPYYRQKHYLCISAPAMPLPPPLPPPGPGHYEVQTPPDSKKKLASGAVFLSTTKRWIGTSSKELPGPGAYDPVFPVRKSYLYNHHHKWI